MSERKVLNKYYPPDFDPTKIPKMRGPRNKTFNIRVMAPFNMRCNTCGEYIYKGKKFNSRKETVENEDYLGLHIFRFYIKCPRCVAEIAFKTDPEKTDYSLEAGATRNFEASKTAMEMAVKEQKAKEEEEMNNPMKVLENRTKASRNEMERIENLEELRELNSRHAKVDHETMIKLHEEYAIQLKTLQDQEDEEIVNAAFGRQRVKRLVDDDDDDDDDEGNDEDLKKKPRLAVTKSSDLLLNTSSTASTGAKSRDTLKNLVKPKSKLSSMSGLVVVKKPSDKSSNSAPETSESTKDNGNVSVNEDETSETTVEQNESSASKTTGALSLLGNYSESEDSE